MVWNIKEDILFGKKNEKKVISWFNKNENQDDWFKAYKLAFKKVDFKNSKIIGELKTRTCSSTYYPDTMFGYNKMKYFNNFSRFFLPFPNLLQNFRFSSFNNHIIKLKMTS